jgi:hypothetical protein
MPARPYRPSGKTEPGALAPLVVGALAAAIVAGLIESFVAQWFSLLIIFPLAIGLAAGGFSAWQIARAKIRAPLLAGLVAGIGGLTGQVAFHAGEYLVFKFHATAEIHASQEGDAGELLDAYLEQQTGSRGFVGYLKFEAEQGTSIRRAGSSHDNGVKVSGLGSYILWLVEVLIAAITAAAMAVGRAREPFCERCKKWYGPASAVSSGAGDKAAVAAVVRAVEVHDMPGAIRAQGEATGKATSVLSLAQCPSCEESDPVLTVSVVVKSGKKTNTSRKYHTLLRIEEAKELRQVAAAKLQSPAGGAAPA